MEAIADEAINEVACMCAAQSGKTLTLLCMVAWIIVNDPGPILWVTANDKEAKKFAKSRLLPLLEKCPLVLEKMPRGNLKTTLEIYFPGSPLIIAGAQSDTALISTPFRYIFLDEVRTYPKGSLELVSKRTRSYPNYKKLVISTPGMENDAVDRAYKAGDQRVREVPCPKCGVFQPLEWGERDKRGGMKWDTTDATHPGSEWNFEALRSTIRYECRSCGHRIPNTISSRKALDHGARWVRQNHLAPANVVSFHWPAMLPWWTKWDEAVFEFLAAQRALKWGDAEPLRVFYNETLGLPFADRLRWAKEEKFLENRLAQYEPRAVWDQELKRFITVDVQGRGGRHFPWVVRAWAIGGMSRLLACGVAWSVGELRSVIADWKVKPVDVGIDSGHFTSEVYEYIIESGVMPDGNYAWKAMKGDKAPSYVVDGVRQPFQWTQVDPYMGTVQQGHVRPLRQLLFSKSAMLDRTEMAMRGMSAPWLIPANLENYHTYMLEVTAYERVTREDVRGVIHNEWAQKREGDHFGSCERMQMVCAMAAGLLDVPRETVPN